MRKPPLQDVIVKNSGERPRRTFQRYPSEITQEQPPVVEKRQVPLEETSPKRSFEYRYEGAMENRPTEPLWKDRRDTPSRGTNKRWSLIALGVGGVIVLSSVILSVLFAGATVTVHPKQDTMVVNTTFTAQENATDGSLSIERVVLERTAQREVKALGEQEVQDRASGKLVIHNEYAETPQRLIKNTRFESSKGNIYRIRESVEIPGKKSDGSPGTIEVTVYAEEPGDSYNITGSEERFSIPGFKGLPQETLMYAVSASDITGGFEGVKRTVSEEERTVAIQELEKQLREELLSAAFSSSDKPEGYHLFKDAVFFEFSALPDAITEGDTVTLSLSGKLHGVLFEEDSFAKRIAQLTLSSYVDSPIKIDNLDELTVTVTPALASTGQSPDAVVEETSREQEGGKNTSNSPWMASTYDVSVQGKSHFIWEFDTETLARDLAGKEKTILNAPVQGGILEAYPGIDRIEASVRPFWKGAFPDEPKDIVVVTELDD